MEMQNYLRISHYVASLLHHTRFSREQLERYQNKKLREVVTYAYSHVPFYHRKFNELSVEPDEIRTVADLRRLPILRRAELQENSEDMISEEFDPAGLKVVATSGSTGRPFFTRITPSEDLFRKVKLLRANMICGQKPRDRWVVITAPQHQAHALAFQRFFGIFSPIPVSVFDGVDAQIARIEKLRPDVLDGYSSSILLLAEEAEKRRLKSIKPRIMIGGADVIDAVSRQRAEEVLDAPFYDEYACVELERLAWQCEKKSDHHIDADTVIMQFVDKNGDEVSAGETGEIVCTSLFNRAMPFIRYAVGDLGRPSDQKLCGCGIEFPLMKVIEGRKEEMVFLPDGRTLSPLAIGDCMCAFQHFNLIVQYRFIQKKLDLFRILIARKKGDPDDKLLERELVSHVRKTLNIQEGDAEIEAEFVRELPLDSTGKIRKVVSEINTR